MSSTQDRRGVNIDNATLCWGGFVHDVAVLIMVSVSVAVASAPVVLAQTAEPSTSINLDLGSTVQSATVKIVMVGRGPYGSREP